MTEADKQDEAVERVAQALLNRRGFGFYADPMEGGQDAYDITLEAIEDARAALAALSQPNDRVRELEAAFFEGFKAAKECLSEDAGYCLTNDVAADCWADFAALNRRKEPSHDQR